jgi:hypothetical protein
MSRNRLHRCWLGSASVFMLWGVIIPSALGQDKATGKVQFTVVSDRANLPKTDLRLYVHADGSIRDIKAHEYDDDDLSKCLGDSTMISDDRHLQVGILVSPDITGHKIRDVMTRIKKNAKAGIFTDAVLYIKEQ